MRIEVKVPQLSESVAEATLVNWHKKAGEAVKRDENLIDIETDKVVLEVPAPGDGVLVEITQGRRLDRHVRTKSSPSIDTDGKADGAAGAQPRRCRAGAAPRHPASAAAAATAPRASATALPAARKMMAEQGVDAADGRRAPAAAAASPRATCSQRARGARTACGAGRRSRRAQPPRRQPRAARCRPSREPLGARPEQRVPMSRLRARVAERLRAVAVDRRDPHDVQRSEHAAGDRAAQPLPGALREGARRQARLHELLRQGGGARAEEVPGRQRVDRRQRHRLPRLLRHRHRGRQPARPGRADPARRRPDVASPRSRRRSPTSASARRTASSRSRS